MSAEPEDVQDVSSDARDADEVRADEGPPAADPTRDEDAIEEEQHATENPIDDTPPAENQPDNDEDAESDLSEIDEATFDDLDTDALYIDTAVNAEDAPVDINETNINLIGTHKRKRVEGEDGAAKKKKKKRKDLVKSRSQVDEDGANAGGRNRRTTKSARRADGKSSSKSRVKTPEILDNMTMEQRDAIELEKRMNEALRRPVTRRPKGSAGDIDTANDEMLDNMSHKMNAAVQTDATDHKAGKPALAKLTLLPAALELLNRNTLQGNIVDPESRILESVRYFLEPLEPDGALPAYDIQREMLGLLSRLPMDKDALISSGIGKVVFFYTKSKRAATSIKRAAEKLVEDWTRPILKRGVNYRSRAAVPEDMQVPHEVLTPQQAQAQAARDRILAKPNLSNRAMVDRKLPTYTVAPQSKVSGPSSSRSAGDGFSRIKARHQLSMRR